MLFLLVNVCLTFGQEKTNVKYFDSSFKETSKLSAYYLIEYVNVDSFFKVSCYWKESGVLKYQGLLKDTSVRLWVGLYRQYYNNGQIKDSTFYNTTSYIVNSYHYYSDGKVLAKYSYDFDKEEEYVEGFSPEGKKLKKFIFSRNAEFRGGKSNWQKYLIKNLRTRVPIKNGAPNGSYKVMVRFKIDDRGNVFDVEPETNFGYGMEDEVLRVVRKSPRWKNAIWLNENVFSYRRQPVTFEVAND